MRFIKPSMHLTSSAHLTPSVHVMHAPCPLHNGWCNKQDISCRTACCGKCGNFTPLLCESTKPLFSLLAATHPAVTPHAPQSKQSHAHTTAANNTSSVSHQQADTMHLLCTTVLCTMQPP